MRRNLVAILVFVIALGGAPILRAADDHPWDNKRIYYIIEFMGHMVERGFFTRSRGSFQKQPSLVVEEERSFFTLGNPNPIRSVRTRTTTTPNGLALQRVETSMMGDESQETITILGNDALFEATGAYGGGGSMPIPGPVLFEVTGEFLASLGTRQTGPIEVFVLDRATRGVVVTGVQIVGQDTPAAGGRPAVWLADITTPGRPAVRARYTEDGRLLRLEGAGMVYQVVARADYDLGRIPRQPVPSEPQPHAPGDSVATAPLPESFPTQPIAAQVGNIVIPVGEDIPAWDNFDWLVLQADPAYDWSMALPNTEYSRAELMGPSMMVTAFRNAPYIDGSVVFPMAVPTEIQTYLGASPTIPSDHQAVVEAAYVAVADTDTHREERNVLRAISYLAGWIFQSVALEEWSGYDSSALDTLANRSGDALGHARLFSAMARTLGVPTRLCQGLMAFRGRAQFHCWSEAWINGRWIPIDTTVSRVGLPAGYILAERGDGRGAFRINFAHFLRSPTLRLRLLTAGRETPSGRNVELRVGDRRTYAVAEYDWMANLYWGFALRLPEGWRGQSRLDSVELTSSDGVGSVRCEALEGDFRAGRPELESTVASLRDSLTRFTVIESRVVTFDDEGATPALYIDFTCEEDGVTLRCKQYVVPRRQRAYRISFWAPQNRFTRYSADFDSILASFEF
ncbi:MAG: transglutaminase-like domain-containing protein [Planctomycetaceae bacterium]|nr:transglutaminase-like domain-containing protein [Planctomycetaceae bacterium]